MQSRIRDAAARARLGAIKDIEASFGLPTEIEFGATASVGDARDAAGNSLFANAEHVHAVPELPDTVLEDFDNFVVLFHDCVLTDDPVTDPPQDLAILRAGAGSDVNTGGFDGTGEAAAFGTLECITGATLGNAAGAFITETAGAGNTTTANVYARRMRRFECRIRPALTVTTLPNRQIAVGAFLTVANGNISNITDGLYFFLETDASGLGTWRAVAKTGSTERSIDTGKSPRFSDDTILFDTLRIDYDGTTASFFHGIFDAASQRTVFTPVGQLTEQIPGESNFVCGWGAVLRTPAAATKTMLIDFLLYKGARVAS